jgi:putative FmdB family regulatory protein
MPVYEFKCDTCNKVFELLLSMNSKPEQDCPDCGGKAVRIISRTAGFIKDSASAVHGYSSGNCDRSDPCCGRDQPCGHRPCEEQ